MCYTKEKRKWVSFEDTIVNILGFESDFLKVEVSMPLFHIVFYEYYYNWGYL